MCIIHTEHQIKSITFYYSVILFKNLCDVNRAFGVFSQGAQVSPTEGVTPTFQPFHTPHLQFLRHRKYYGNVRRNLNVGTAQSSDPQSNLHHYF